MIMTTNTTKRFPKLCLRAVLAATPLLPLGLVGTGCSAGRGADLRLTSLASEATFRQQFSRAYVNKSADGCTEVVLVKGAPAETSPDARLAAATTWGESTSVATAGSVRQVMHVRVLWRPQRGTKQSHPSYTNAGLHWYVVGDSASGTPEVLEYSGAGFVSLAEVPGGTQVTIRNATLKPVNPSATTLTDPVGPAKLTGTFLAKRSAKRVNDTLAEVKTAAAAGAQQASAH
jgi:hypothetical protein